MKELDAIQKEASTISPEIAKEIGSVVDELNKSASLLEDGDRIVCVNPVQGIYKGRIYILEHYVRPNYALITETDGSRVGIFRADRFTKDTREY